MQMLKSTLQKNHKPCCLESKKDNPQESSKREVLRWANRIWIQNKSYGASAHQSMRHQTQTSTDLRPMIHCTICTIYIYINLALVTWCFVFLCRTPVSFWTRWVLCVRICEENAVKNTTPQFHSRETWSTYDLSRLPKDQVQLLHVERLAVKWKQGERIRACNCWHDFPPTTPQLTLDVHTKSENLGPKMRGNKPVDCAQAFAKSKGLKMSKQRCNARQKAACRKFCLTANHSLLLWVTDVGGQPPNIEIFWFEGRFQPHISKRGMRNLPLNPKQMIWQWTLNSAFTHSWKPSWTKEGVLRFSNCAGVLWQCCEKVFFACICQWLKMPCFQFLSYCSFKYCVTWRYWCVFPFLVQALSSSIQLPQSKLQPIHCQKVIWSHLTSNFHVWNSLNS